MVNKYIIKIAFIGMTILVSFSSCNVLNKYHSPQIDTSDLYRDIYLSETDSILSISWKDFFEDFFLQSLIEEGVMNNYDLQIAFQKIRQAEFANQTARAAYFPSVAISAQTEIQRLNSNPTDNAAKKFMGNHNENYTLGIVSSWELDVWGKIKSQGKAATAEMLHSYAGYNLIQTSLISTIANSYFSLLALDEQLFITKEMIETVRQSLQIIKHLKDAGLMTGAAIEQTNATLYEMLATIPDIENEIDKLENSICQLIGRNPGEVKRKTINDQHVIYSFKSGIPLHTVSHRPDIQQAELELRRAFELTNVAKAQFYPTLTLNSGVLGYSSVNKINNFFRPDNLFLNIVGGITQPIFEKKRIRKQYEIANAEQQIALINFEKNILNACIEISDIMKTYEMSFRKTEIRNIQIESLYKSVFYTQELLVAGEATYLEVLTAQQGLLEARLNQVTDKLQQLQTYSDLYRALGGSFN